MTNNTVKNGNLGNGEKYPLHGAAGDGGAVVGGETARGSGELEGPGGNMFCRVGCCGGSAGDFSLEGTCHA